MGSFLFALLFIGLVISLLILPIYITVDGYFDAVSAKIGCQLSLYGRIKLVGGYIQPCSGGFAFHVSKKKAKLFTYRQIDEGRKQIAIDRAFTITSIRTIIELAPEYTFGVFALTNLAQLISLFMPQVPTIENRMFLREQGFRAFLRIGVCFSLMSILFASAKYLFRRWTRECRTKKSAIS